MGFVKGSHQYFDYLRGFPYEAMKSPVSLNRLRIIPYLNLLSMKAGEAVVFNHKTIHGSLSNYTADERIAISMGLRPVDSPMWVFYIKPGEDTLLKYDITAEFYLDYNDPRMDDGHSRRRRRSRRYPGEPETGSRFQRSHARAEEPIT